MRIYLIGFMGSGKTTLGKQAADVLEVPFFDTDSAIESRTEKSISEIFEIFGEAHFRNLETETLNQSTSNSKSIIATGGGLPCFNGNMAWMNREGITIYLQWPDEVLVKHLENHRGDRPLLKRINGSDRKETVLELLQIRKPFYEQAAITLEMKGVVENDLKLLEKACKYIW